MRERGTSHALINKREKVKEITAERMENIISLLFDKLKIILDKIHALEIIDEQTLENIISESDLNKPISINQ